MNDLWTSIYALYFVRFGLGTTLPRAGCSISVNEHLTNPQPLLLLQNEAENDLGAFLLPDDSGTLFLPPGNSIDVACPGSYVIVGRKHSQEVVISATCKSGIQFKVSGRTASFTSIKCLKKPVDTARYTGSTCGEHREEEVGSGGRYKEFEIGFEVNNRFIRHIVGCFDKFLQSTLWVKSTLSPAIAGRQSKYPRRTFIEGEFFDVEPDRVDKLYSRKLQRSTINKLLGLRSGSTSIIQDNKFYLARGHYAPKADFVFGAQQTLTFYFVNAAPQWQSFNAGNWLTLENNCRKLASERRWNLTVFTGGYGRASLHDVNGHSQDLFLWVGDCTHRGIPVPALYFKVLYEPVSQAGIALIGLNNPYKKYVESDVICKDVCYKVKWLTWKAKKIDQGYSYCCEVDDFRQIVSTLPEFTVKKLLV